MKGRKSIGELDVTSFLSTLGSDDEDDEDDGSNSEGSFFYDAKAETTRMTNNDQSFATAVEEEEEAKEEERSKTKKGVVSAKKQPIATKVPLSAIKKVKSDSEDSDDEDDSKSGKQESSKKANEKETGGKSAAAKLLAATKKKLKEEDTVETKGDEAKEKKNAGDLKKSSKVKFALESPPKGTAKGDREKEENPTKRQKIARKDTPAKSKKAKQEEEPEEEENEDDDDEEDQHRRELEELKRKDPEFYKHLQEEASDLLHFGDDDDENEDGEDEGQVSDDDDDEEEEEEDEDEEDATRAEQQAELAIASLKRLEARALRGDASATRKLIRALKNGLQTGFASKIKKKTRAQQEAGDFDDDANELERRAMAFNVAPEVYERLVSVTLTRIATALDNLLWPSSTKEKDNDKKQKKTTAMKLAGNSPHFSAHKMKIRQLLSCFSRVLQSRDTSPHVLQRLLLSLRSFIGYFASIPSEGKRLLTVLVTLWSRAETEGSARIACFFRVRQLCDVNAREFAEPALKDMYVAFARSSNSARTGEVRERIAVQARCLVEIYGMDFALSYRVGFSHIRQLALHVRAAMASKSLESLQSVCSWQFVHCLRLWGMILSTHSLQLSELKFPLIQVALGVLSLVSTSKYDPLRLHCVEVINRVCEVRAEDDESPVFAPVAIHLLNMLNASDLMDKKTVPSTDAPPELSAMLKFKDEQIRKPSTRLVLIPRICELLKGHLKQHRSSVSFPELWIPTKAALQSAIKLIESKSQQGEAWRNAGSKALREVVDTCDEWSAKVKEAREGRNAAVKRPGGPSNVDGCDKFQRAMRDLFQADDERKLSKKQRKALTVKEDKHEDDGEKVDLEQTVESILSEAAKEMADKTREADEEDREMVKKLNPKDFL